MKVFVLENPSPQTSAARLDLPAKGALLQFHLQASRDPERTKKLRQWHAGQASELAKKSRREFSTAFSWSGFCKQFGGAK
jgi:hypothetical protein